MLQKIANRVFTSESVTEGHPDKMCDQISDAVLDTILAKDKKARVACECIAATGMIIVFGEITTDCYVDIPAIVRNTVREVGYDNPEFGFDCKTCAVLTSIDEQSPDIAMGVNASYECRENNSIKQLQHLSQDEKALNNITIGCESDETGAGDQGMMFGFACDETPELMPAPISFAHKLSRRLAEVRKSGQFDWLRPDGKTQVTVQYGADGSVERIPAIVVSTQHGEHVSTKDLREAVMECVIKPVIPANLIDADTKFFINPTGRFVIGGPVGDSGLTGRKIIVDTYGGYACHGGGCFSGKDPTKVDRSATYMARYIAKNIVAAGLAKRCQLEIAYAIGVANPVSVVIDTQGTGLVSDVRLAELVTECFDLRPAKIIKKLDLLRPIYRQTAAYGHFGRTDIDLPWEHTDMVELLREHVK